MQLCNSDLFVIVKEKKKVEIVAFVAGWEKLTLRLTPAAESCLNLSLILLIILGGNKGLYLLDLLLLCSLSCLSQAQQMIFKILRCCKT